MARLKRNVNCRVPAAQFYEVDSEVNGTRGGTGQRFICHHINSIGSCNNSRRRGPNRSPSGRWKGSYRRKDPDEIVRQKDARMKMTAPMFPKRISIGGKWFVQREFEQLADDATIVGGSRAGRVRSFAQATGVASCGCDGPSRGP